MIEIIKSSLLEEHGFKNHGFTLRNGGLSKEHFSSLNLAFSVGDDPESVRQNLLLLQKKIGANKPLLRVNQTHGNNVITSLELMKDNEKAWTFEPKMEGDAIIGVPGDASFVSAVQVADCAPVLLADTSCGLTAAIHAGWRGTAKGVIRNTVKKMLNMGASLQSLVAVIGPCICLNCYEVDEKVANNFPESTDPIRKKHGKFLLDLQLAVEVSLIGAGLFGDRIDRIKECTCCDSDRHFSYRGSGGECGRHLSFIETCAKI